MSLDAVPGADPGLQLSLGLSGVRSPPGLLLGPKGLPCCRQHQRLPSDWGQKSLWAVSREPPCTVCRHSIARGWHSPDLHAAGTSRAPSACQARRGPTGPVQVWTRPPCWDRQIEERRAGARGLHSTLSTPSSWTPSFLGGPGRRPGRARPHALRWQVPPRCLAVTPSKVRVIFLPPPGSPAPQCSLWNTSSSGVPSGPRRGVLCGSGGLCFPRSAQRQKHVRTVMFCSFWHRPQHSSRLISRESLSFDFLAESLSGQRRGGRGRLGRGNSFPSRGWGLSARGGLGGSEGDVEPGSPAGLAE